MNLIYQIQVEVNNRPAAIDYWNIGILEYWRAAEGANTYSLTTAAVSGRSGRTYRVADCTLKSGLPVSTLICFVSSVLSFKVCMPNLYSIAVSSCSSAYRQPDSSILLTIISCQYSFAPTVPPELGMMVKGVFYSEDTAKVACLPFLF